MDQFIKLRRQVHRFPQKSGDQHKTVERIIASARSNGVKEESIIVMKHPLAGLWIDLHGQAQPSGKDVCIAIRADIDALTMTEHNQHLEYRSENEGVAHTCGHDGHLAVLAATVPIFLNKLKDVPRNKSVRLLFQPSQQAIDPNKGAKEMINEGCLKGVNQIYGFHNINVPMAPFGYFSCKPGVVMSSSTLVDINIKGTGGHASQPQAVKFALPKAVTFYDNLLKFIEELRKKVGQPFTAVFPVLQSGQRFNVISQKVILQGNLRTFSVELREIILKFINNQLKKIEEQGFHTQVTTISGSLTENTSPQAQHVIRLAQKLYGENMAGDIGLPTKASEDFGEYTKVVPGAFFFVCGADQIHQGIPHSPDYNFNDRLIPLVSNFWVELALDRFANL